MSDLILTAVVFAVAIGWAVLPQLPFTWGWGWMNKTPALPEPEPEEEIDLLLEEFDELEAEVARREGQEAQRALDRGGWDGLAGIESWRRAKEIASREQLKYLTSETRNFYY